MHYVYYILDDSCSLQYIEASAMVILSVKAESGVWLYMFLLFGFMKENHTEDALDHGDRKYNFKLKL